MDNTGPFFTRAAFWRRFITIGLFLLFVVLFWHDIGLALLGWWNLIRVVVLGQWVEFDSGTLKAILNVTSNVLVYLGVYAVSLFVVAQFTLPVQDWEERRSSFERLALALFNWHGTTVFIREGKCVTKVGKEEDEEREKEDVVISNPGVALVDLSSAVVLEQPSWRGRVDSEEDSASSEQRRRPFFFMGSGGSQKDGLGWMRVCGPGVNFTKYGERIHSVVDLRRQVRIESGVKARTRDGIEVTTNMWSIFSLSDSPDVLTVAYVEGTALENLYALDLAEDKEKRTITIQGKFELDPVDAMEIHRLVEADGIHTEAPAAALPSSGGVKTPYFYDADRVFLAACSETGLVNPDGKKTLWHQLPQYITIETFQNLLAQYPYDRLYSPIDEAVTAGDASTAAPASQQDEPFFKKFKKELNHKVMYQGVVSYKLLRLSRPPQSVSQSTKWNALPLSESLFYRPWPVAGYEISAVYPLTSSKVLRDRGIKIVAVGFPEIKSPPEVRDRIADSWKARLDRQIAITQANSNREAMKVINDARTQTQRDSTNFLSDLSKKGTHSKEALALLLFQALENAASNPSQYKDIPPKEILAMLQNLHRWLLIEREEAERRERGQKGGDNAEHQHSVPRDSV